MKNNQFNLQALLESGDREGIYNCAYPVVRLVASTRLTGCPAEDIEDIISGVIVKLFDKDCSALRTIREVSSSRSWVIAVTLNATRDYFRRRRMVISLDGAINENGRTLHDVLAGGVPDPMDTIAWEEIRSSVWGEINKLGGIYRDIIRDRFARRLGVSDISLRRGITESTVYVRLSRAFDMLRPALEEFRNPAVR